MDSTKKNLDGVLYLKNGLIFMADVDPSEDDLKYFASKGFDPKRVSRREAEKIIKSINNESKHGESAEFKRRMFPCRVFGLSSEKENKFQARRYYEQPVEVKFHS